MANPQHVKILEKGVEKWNDWRYEHPKVTPDLSDANLKCAYVQEVDFSGTNLSKTNLSEANLSEANFSAANLSEALLNKANLKGAIFAKTNLHKAKLVAADLSGASFSGADLSKARLVGAIIRNASFRATRLLDAILDEADITGARLWQTQRAGWSIKGIVCESAYWEEEERTDYDPGDFERLFTEKVKVRVFYENGISPLEIMTLPLLVERLEESYPGCKLRLISINESSKKVVVELAIEESGNDSPVALAQLKTDLEAHAKQAVEYQRLALLEKEKRLQLEGEVRQLTSVFNALILRPSIVLNNQGGFMGDTYNVSGQAGAVGANAHAHDMNFNIANHLEKTVDFAKLARELADMRQTIAAKHDASPEAAIALGKVAEAEIAANEKNALGVVESLKIAGKWTLDFAKEIGKDVVVEAIKQSMGMP